MASTKADLKQAHRAKMARKAARIITTGFTVVPDKRFAGERARLTLLGRANEITPNLSRWARHGVSTTSYAQINAKTGKPNLHLREIARHQRQSLAA